MDRRQYFAESAAFIRTMISTRDSINRNIQSNNQKINELDFSIGGLEEAKHIITNEKNEIQRTLKEDIDSLVTIAINIVYNERDIKFAMLFDKSPAGVSQYKPVLIEHDEEYSPKEDQCGGSLDVISYALRIILKSFEKPKGRDFMLFDEPFKFLGGGLYAERAAEMAKKINEDLGIQSLIISHDVASISRADVIYHVDHDGRKSVVERSIQPQVEEKIERVR